MSSGSIPYLGADTDYRNPHINNNYYDPYANPTSNSGSNGQPGDAANYIGLLNSSLKGTNLSTGGSTSNPILTTDQPWGNYPDGHEPFDEVQNGNGIGIPAVGGAAITLFTYIVPNGYNAVVERYSINFTGGGLDGYNFGDLVWRVYVNGKLVRNFDNIQSERGTYQQPRPISNLRFNGGDIITVTVEHPNNFALSGNSTISLSGYIYPVTTLSNI